MMNPFVLTRSTRNLRPVLAAVVVALLTLAPGLAGAWGGDGHRLIAAVADTRLSPVAKLEADRLLALEPDATLMSISTWADEVRDPATAAWHYVNFPRGGSCTYGASQLCPDGACVVSAIERYAAMLASKAPDTERLLALKYVVHFVADIHQPLHAGYGDDRGGNSYQLQAYDEGTNLHSLWDSRMIRNWPGGLPALQAAVNTVNTVNTVNAVGAVGGVARGEPRAWAEASCLIVGRDGFYPATHTLDADYAARWSATVVTQLAAASRRLAAVLNTALETPR